MNQSVESTVSLRPSFLEGKGEMAALIGDFDWSATSAGPLTSWPQSLRVLVSMLLRSKFPMLLLWGNDLLNIYNDAFRQSLGDNGRHPQSLGRPARDTWADIWPVIEPLFSQVMTGGESVWQEDARIPIASAGAEPTYWTFSCSAVRDDEDRINGILVVCCETTEKINSIQKAEESHKLLSFAIDAADLATWDLDPVSGRLSGNERLAEWFGLQSCHDIPLQDAINAIQENDRESVTTAIRDALEYSSGGHYEAEYSVINLQNGRMRRLKAMGKALFDENRNPVRFNGTLQDITEEVRAREQEQKLLTLVDNSVDLMSILEMNGKNSYINAAGRRILGIAEDADVSTIPIADFHTKEQLAFVEAEIIPNVMTKGKWSGQFEIRNGISGEIIPLFNNCHRINDAITGAPIGIGAVMRDMRPELNARKELEEKVIERTKALQEANEELEQKNRDLASFAYVSSHDLQEPLRKINTFLSRIEDESIDNLSERQKDFFERIRKSSFRMQALINDLLSFSRASAVEPVFELTPLDDILREVMANLQEKITATAARIEADPLPMAYVIPFQFGQLFENLLSNAIKFTRPGEAPHITIRCEAADNGHRIVFEDRGIGFEQQYEERIFEVFQRLHGRNEYEGTGIGLAICKRIMDNHDGTIRAEGKPNEGARFVVELRK